MSPILLTRADSLNLALAQHPLFSGREVVSLPLMEARELGLDPTKKDLILSLDQFDKIIFISKNAVKFGLPLLEDYWPQWPTALDWFAVGSSTAEVLSRYDIAAKYPHQASSEGLLALSELAQVLDQQCLIVRGIGGRETLRIELEKRSAKVRYLEVYERLPVHHERHVFPQRAIALVYSGEALQHLYDLVGDLIQQYSVIVPSERLANIANGLGFGKVGLAKSQADHAMLDILEKTLEQ